MKRQISLKWFLVLSFLAMTIFLVAGYTVLSLVFFDKGITSAVTFSQIRTVSRYVETVPAAQREGLHDFDGVSIASGWEWMPESVRGRFQRPPMEEGTLHIREQGRRGEPASYVDSVLLVRQGGASYFVWQRLTFEMMSPLMGRQATETLRMLFSISGITVVTLCVFVWLLCKKIVRPGRALSAWAASLDERALREPPPDFSYPELNGLAELIQNSLFSVGQSLDRERLFLRYSSHELRTPISVIRASVELLQKMALCSGADTEGREAKVINRIDRAGQTMQHLVETLLWLSRDTSESLQTADIRIEELLQEVIRDAEYLLHGKNIELVVDTVPCVASVPETAFSIVLGNLVRNAFQHTRRGIIHITQREKKIEVVNYMAEENDMADDIGFGLGLQLVERLVDKFGWAYSNQSFPGRHAATLNIDTEK